jgi:hypothetical protein
MPIQYKAGTPATRKYDPPGRGGSADARGVYQTSAFYASLSNLVGTTVTLDTTLAEDTVELLLFTSDLPLICRSYVYDASSAQTNSTGCENRGTLENAFVTDAAGGGSAVLVSNLGEVIKGFSGVGQLVPVSGFAARVTVVPPSSTNVTVAGSTGVVEPGLASAVGIMCIANAANLIGVIGSVFPDKSGNTGGILTAPTPVILKSSDYTAAMRTSRNLITDGAGKQYQIVGLYFIDLT